MFALPLFLCPSADDVCQEIHTGCQISVLLKRLRPAVYISVTAKLTPDMFDGIRVNGDSVIMDDSIFSVVVQRVYS